MLVRLPSEPLLFFVFFDLQKKNGLKKNPNSEGKKIISQHASLQ